MNKLSPAKRAQILTALIEGNSIASTCRMTGAAKMTVLSLIREIGQACLRFHDAQVRYLPTLRVQCDEVWSFCYAKEKNVPADLKGKEGYGSLWTWTALDADSKLLISWMVSDRNQEAADALIRDLKMPHDDAPSDFDRRPIRVPRSHREELPLRRGRSCRGGEDVREQ
ncbi:MAG: hypothetical protein JO197_12210 [Acidobacteria bacterium]|nr:hypothetical protein [Acidobacteriota bacterium]MBV9475307.1 hypothetical protein [Acidobacteriota bacterium]